MMPNDLSRFCLLRDDGDHTRSLLWTKAQHNVDFALMCFSGPVMNSLEAACEKATKSRDIVRYLACDKAY